jgi:hypothetical protein
MGIGLMALEPVSYSNINSAVDPSTWQSLGNLGKVYQQAQADQLKQNTLAQLGPDAAKNANLLISSGHPDLAQLGLTLQNRLQDQQREDARFAVTDARANAQLAIQQAQEGRAAAKDEEDSPTWRAKNLVAQGIDPRLPESKAYIIGKGYTSPDASNQYEIKEIDNNGVKTLVRVRKQGPEGVIPGTEPGPAANPFVSGGGKGMNHDQAQAASYTDRMAEAHDTINKFETINQGVGGATGGTVMEAAKNIPYGGNVVRNWFLSGDRQQFDQAKRNFVNAILRKESGAAISPSEFANAEQQYFPQPGDSADVIALKQQNRLTAMHGMAREAGAAYRPPATIIPPELRAPSAGQGTGADEALRLARNDLANRVPRDQVEARLQAQGIDPAELDRKPKAVVRTGTVNDGPNKGKTVILYSDGTKEYK